MDGQITRRQHIVSAVVLRRFHDESGRLGVQGIQGEHHRLSVANAEAYIRDFVSVDHNVMERKWGKVEKRMPEVFAALETGNIFGARAQYLTDVIKQLMSLHAVRSYNTRLLWIQGSEQDTWIKAAEAWHDNGELMAAYKHDVNSNPTVVDRMVLIRNFRNDLKLSLLNGNSFRKFVAEMASKFETYLRRSRVEVAMAPVGKEFVIGDNPVIIRDSTTSRVGVFEGVGLTSADSILFPLGPKHLIALNSRKGSQNKFAMLTPEQVDQINEFQVKYAHQHVYYRPGSDIAL